MEARDTQSWLVGSEGKQPRTRRELALMGLLSLTHSFIFKCLIIKIGQPLISVYINYVTFFKKKKSLREGIIYVFIIQIIKLRRREMIHIALRTHFYKGVLGRFSRLSL